MPAAGRRRLLVIRYDNRDTGRSTSYESGAPPYDADDLTDDAVAVLDGYGLDRAHVAGMSMGGMIAQLVERRYPERVASLTVISSTALSGTGAELPGPDPAYLEHAAAAESSTGPTWTRSRSSSCATCGRSRAWRMPSTSRRRASTSPATSPAPAGRRASSTTA